MKITNLFSLFMLKLEFFSIHESDSENDEEPSHRRPHSLFGSLGAQKKQPIVNKNVLQRPLFVVQPPEPIYDMPGAAVSNGIFSYKKKCQ